MHYFYELDWQLNSVSTFPSKAASLLQQLTIFINYGKLHMSFTSLRNQPDADIDP